MTEKNEPKREESPGEKAIHEYIDVEFTFHAGLDPVFHAQLNETLQALPGLQSFSLGDKLLVLRYDPLRLTKKKLIEKIKGVGLPIEEVGSAPTSPLTDAFAHEESPPPFEAE